jgi:hypothetical protein
MTGQFARGFIQMVQGGLNDLLLDPRRDSIRAYWATQIAKAMSTKPGDYTKTQFSKLGGLISQHFNNNEINPVANYVVLQPATQNDSLKVLSKLLNFQGLDKDEPLLKRPAKGELLALMLNVVSGKVSQTQVVTKDGMTLSQAITYCDLLVNDLDVAIGDVPDDYKSQCGQNKDWLRYVKASFIAGLINVGVTLPQASIPYDVVNFAYKQHGDHEQVPTSFVLGQNYPNPFNPTTRISFDLPKSCEVKLEVYNLLGQRVKTLLSGQMTAGSHGIDWNSTDENGKQVSSGIYLYRLTAGEYLETKKMVLLK